MASYNNEYLDPESSLHRDTLRPRVQVLNVEEEEERVRDVLTYLT
jgi:hypothetical protein